MIEGRPDGVQVVIEQIRTRVERHRRGRVPSIRSTTFTFAPVEVARLAAVWRRIRNVPASMAA